MASTVEDRLATEDGFSGAAASLRLFEKCSGIATGWWKSVAESAASGFAGLFEGARVEHVGNLLVVGTRARVHAVVVQTLWAPDHPAILEAASLVGLPSSTLPLCPVFDALRRPGWFLASGGQSSISS